MSTLDTGANNAVTPYHSLAELRESHTSLLKRHRAGETVEVLDEIETFVRRASVTGTLLDNDNDRYASQSLLDFWVTVLYRAKRTPPDATLAEFDPSLSPKLDDTLCPYRGLNAFQEEDKDIFFGRKRLIELLFQKINETRLLFVLGPSGSGKSSLVLAGLIPALKNDQMPGSEAWQYFPRMVPGADPLRYLAATLNKVYQHPTDWIPQQVEQLKKDDSHLLKLVVNSGDQPAVLVVDQFEEVFTLCRDDDMREAFINNLITLADSPGARHLVILTLRSDFESYIVQSPKLMSFFEKGQVRITPLTATDLRDAIDEPARRIGLKFEEGVVDALVKDILGEPAALPLLQFTLLRLWRMREDGRNRITLREYRKLGGARRALGLVADELYQQLSDEKQITAKRILLRLARPTGNAEVLSNPVRRESLYFENPDRVNEVVADLYEAGLVKITKGATPANDKIEIAHEALVRNWPRLVDWIETARSTMRQRMRLTVAAEQWREHGRDEGGLLGGSLLAEARQHEDLNILEKEFVDESIKFAERAEREKEEARERDRELERAKMLAVQLKAEEIIRNTRRLRIFVPILTVLTFFSITAAVAAVVFARRAGANEKSARASESLARRRQSEAEDERGRANAEATRAGQQAALAERRRNETEVARMDAIEAKGKAESANREAQEQAQIAKEAEAEATKYSRQVDELNKKNTQELEFKTQRERADAQLKRKRIDDAIEIYRSLVARIDRANDPNGAANALSTLARAYEMLEERAKRNGNQVIATQAQADGNTHYNDALQLIKAQLSKEEIKEKPDQAKIISILEDEVQFFKEHNKSTDAIKATSDLEARCLQALDTIEKSLTNANYKSSNYDDFVDKLTELYRDGKDNDKLESLYKRTLNARRKTIAEEIYGYYIYESLNILATFYRETGKGKEAVPLYVEALEIVKKTVEQQNVGQGYLIESQKNLASLRLELGETEEAEKIYRESLNTVRKAMSPTDVENELLAEALARLAEVLKKQSKFDEALTNYNDAIKIYEVDANSNAKALAQSYTAIGEIYQRQAKLPEAERSFKASVAAVENSDSQEVKKAAALGLINLANMNYMYAAKAKPEDIQKYLETAGDLLSRANSLDLDRELQRKAIDSDNLFLKLIEQKRFDQGAGSEVDGLEQLLNVRERRIMKGEPGQTSEVDTVISRLEKIYNEQHDRDKLIALNERALTIRTRVYGGTKNPSVYGTYSTLGQLYREAKNYKKAEANYLEALKIVEKVFGKEGTGLVVESLYALAGLNYDQGKMDEAESYYKRAMSNLEKAKAGESVEMADVLEGYAKVLRDTDRNVEADGLIDRARDIRRKERQNRSLKKE